MTTYLLNSGADPNVESDEGLTPLKYAVARGDTRLVTEVLKRGAGQTIAKITAPEGWNAVHLAAYDLNVPIMRLLLDAGADPEVPDTDGNKALALLPLRSPANENQWNEAYELLTRSRAPAAQ